MQGLEVSLMGIGYQIWDEPDGCDDYCEDSDGIKALTLGARYQFMPMLIAALDVKVPLNGENLTPGDYDPFGLYAAIQYTQEFMPGLALGSEAGLTIDFEDEDVSHGLVLTLQAELDYTIANIGLTPWVGFAFNVKLTDDEMEVAGFGTAKDNGGDTGFSFWVGACYAINQMIGVKANITFNGGDNTGVGGGDNDAMVLSAGAEFNF